MKTFLVLLLLSCLVVAQGPTSYSVARTDQKTTQPAAAPSDWGGAIGAGKKICFSDWNGICVTRLTDANTVYPNTPHYTTITTADSGAKHLVSKNSNHILVHTTGGTSIVIAYNFTKGVINKTPLRFNYNPDFATKTDTVLFGLVGTALHKVTVKGDWSDILSDVVLYDFASTGCLGAGFVPTWNGSLSIGQDAIFKTSFSNTGGQGSGHYVTAWSQSMGCTVFDSVSGTVTVRGKLIGTVTNNDRFFLHETGGGNELTSVLVSNTVRQPNGASGCVAGNCATDGPYVWQIGTINLMSCGLTKCDGHGAQFATGFMTGKGGVDHFWADPSKPLIKLLNFPNTWPDHHGSGNNYADLNGPAIFVGSQQVNSPSTFPSWGYNEIDAVRADGSGFTWRFGPTGATGKSNFFVCANAIINEAPNGLYTLFTSDMGGNGVLGKEIDGTDRCDIFAMENK
jgi:hypothetical protein